MDHKRELTSVDLRALEAELGHYEEAKVDKVYLYGDDLLRIRMRHYDLGRIELLVEVGDVKRLHAADPDRVPDAPERPPNFAKMLRNRIGGADFAGAEQYGFDRIVRLEFERPDQDTTIVAELFGDGNVAVLDETGAVVDSLETVRLRSRTVAPGAQYEFPEERVDPLDIDYETFRAHMDDSDTDVVRTLATQLDLGGDWAEEICTRAGVEKTLAIDEAGDEQYEPLHDALSRLAEDFRSGTLDARVYYEDDEPVDVTPVPLEEHGDLESEPYDTFDEALDHYFFELERADDEDDAAAETSQRPDFESEIETQERIIAQQEGAIEEFEEEAQTVRESAEALYAHYELVDEILTTTREALDAGHDWDDVEARFEEGAEQGIEAAEAVEDLDPSEGRIRVRVGESVAWLDPREGVEHNADRLYREAKEIEGKKEGAQAAIEDTRERLEEIEERKEQWEAEDQADENGGEGDDEDGGRSDEEWLSSPSIPVRSTDNWFERFRWVRTSGGFLILGGRDADDNEELVKKYLEPGDRFFHTEVHGGPVTILKAADPSESGRDVEIPEADQREAARFAVSYSSIWKAGKFTGDVYAVDHDQASKTAESGEFLEKGGFAIRGDRTYYDDVEVGVAVGIQCEPETRVIGGPPECVADRAVTTIEVEPGKFAQGDVGKRMYREFRERFSDTSFVRKVASPDLIQHFLPPGGSRIKQE